MEHTLTGSNHVLSVIGIAIRKGTCVYNIVSSQILAVVFSLPHTVLVLSRTLSESVWIGEVLPTENQSLLSVAHIFTYIAHTQGHKYFVCAGLHVFVCFTKAVMHVSTCTIALA